MHIKNERSRISKFWSDKSCALVLALIWNQPEFCNSPYAGALGISLGGHNLTLIIWISSTVRRIELKFLADEFLIRVNHPWKFQPKQTLLSEKSILRRGGALKTPVMGLSPIWPSPGYATTTCAFSNCTLAECSRDIAGSDACIVA